MKQKSPRPAVSGNPVWIALALLAVLAIPCHAQAAKPKPIPPIPLDDRGDSKLASALKTICKGPYEGMTSTQRSKVVAAFKKFISLTIGFYLEDDGNECNAMLGASLRDFCDSRKKKVNIVIDFGQKEPVKVTPDGSTDATPKDTVSISGSVFKKLPGVRDAADFNGPDAALPVPPSHDPTVRRLIVELMSEALRIKQETKLPEVASSCALSFRNDVDVVRRKIDIEKDLKAQLQKLLEDPFFFSDAKYRINRQVIRKIQDEDTEEGRKAVAMKYLNYICNKRIPELEKGLAADWVAFKKKFGIMGNDGVDKIDETVKEAIEIGAQPINFELWTGPSKKIASFSVPDGLIDVDAENAYVGGGGTYDLGGGSPETVGDTLIAQIPAENHDVTFLEVTGVDHVYHAAITDGGQTLLVSGGEDTTGDGVIIAYSDTDSDGLFEPGTRTEVIRDFNIYGGTHFLTDSPSGNLLIFGRLGQELYELGKSGGAAHGFPDMLTYRGSLGFQRFDLQHAQISGDGLTARATGRWDFPVGADTLVPYSTASIAGGEFMPVTGNDYHPFNDDEREPIAIRRPVEGDTWAWAAGRPGATLMAYEVSGVMSPLGIAATVDADGSAMIALGRSLSTTDIIRFYDTSTFESSPDHPVIPLSWKPVITSARFVPYGKFLINYEGVPGFGVTFGKSLTLTLPFTETALPQLDNIGTHYYEADIDDAKAFFRIGTFREF